MSLNVVFASIQVSATSPWHNRPLLDLGFHEIPEREWSTPDSRGIDPILDVVLRNQGENAVVVGAVGLVLLRLRCG
jgi:hypothetical protein